MNWLLVYAICAVCSLVASIASALWHSRQLTVNDVLLSIILSAIPILNASMIIAAVVYAYRRIDSTVIFRFKD